MKEDRGQTHGKRPILLPGQEKDPATSFLPDGLTPWPPSCLNSTLLHSSKIYQAMVDGCQKRGMP